MDKKKLIILITLIFIILIFAYNKNKFSSQSINEIFVDDYIIDINIKDEWFVVIYEFSIEDYNITSVEAEINDVNIASQTERQINSIISDSNNLNKKVQIYIIYDKNKVNLYDLLIENPKLLTVKLIDENNNVINVNKNNKNGYSGYQILSYPIFDEQYMSELLNK